MPKRKRTFFWAGIAVAGLLWGSALMWAQTSTDFDASWDVLGSGGPGVASESFRVEWTVGQSMVGAASGAGVAETGGFWAGFVAWPVSTVEPTATPGAEVTPVPNGADVFLPLVTNE